MAVALIIALVAFPFAVAAAAFLFGRTQLAMAWIVRVGAVAIIAMSVAFGFVFFHGPTGYRIPGEWLRWAVLGVDALICAYVIFVGVTRKSVLLMIFAAMQIIISAFLVFSGRIVEAPQTIYIDRLTIIMIEIVGVIGSLICVYAVEYMKDYHRHHPEFQDRRRMFFAVLFVFLGAMSALVIANDLTLMLLFWEITSLCSFLLIGYTKTDEAKKNAMLAIVINVGGGLAFSIGIAVLAIWEKVGDMNGLLALGNNTGVVLIAVFALAVAGLTKSAQMPFSGWLLGAMVAPTPTSALLHSSTMVKAGVYLIIRLAPLLGNNAVGYTVTLVGAVTFFVAAAMAISQSDAKKVLAYSTISNLGLIVACAGINTAESLWAAIMLIIFHAIAKSLLFLSVGSTEHQVGSRNIEDMDGLYKVSRTLAMLLIIGIAGMFVAPFGMLISKWAAMKAFIQYGNIIVVLILAFGSTITFFFWSKWMGKLIANSHIIHPQQYKMRNDERVTLFSLAGMVVIVCLIYPVISKAFVAPFITGGGESFTTPLDSTDTMVIMLMMFALFLLPLLLMPLYRHFRVKDTTIYMSGENTGDNESYRGSAGTVRQVQLRNWYMSGIFGEAIWSAPSKIICTVLLAGGFLFTIGGLIIK